VEEIAEVPVDVIAMEETEPSAVAAPGWTPLARVAFRIAFIFFFCFIFLCGNGTLFSIFPVVGNWIDTALTWPTNQLAVWVGQHVFHLSGVGAKWHPTGSGDTTLNWIAGGLFVLYSLVGGAVWTLAAVWRGNRRTEYRTLYAWLRFGLRLTCGMYMMNYGLAKLYPLQMAPISIGILNEPVGNMSPMTFLWALIGMNPAYEMVCGFAEVVGGVLLLFRRTALMGALLSSFVMANVVLYNFFFDVPVKLFAMALLLGCLFLAFEDVPAMFRFFWKHEPAETAGVWFPPISRKGWRVTTRAVEVVFMVAFLVAMPVLDGIAWWQGHKAAQVKTPLLGAWKLDPAHQASGAFVTPEGSPATELYVDTSVRAFMRSASGELWRTRLTEDDKAHTLRVRCYVKDAVMYTLQMPDENHVVLTSKAPEPPKGKTAQPFTPEVVTLTRVPVPAHYPLLDRGFHLVNQWGLER
jgi:hypothetical protein